MYVRVQPDITKIEKTYWYIVDDETKFSNKIIKGSIVRIEVHGRRTRAWVLEVAEKSELINGDLDFDLESLKSVVEFVSSGPPEHLVDYCLELSRYYLCSPVVFLRSASPLRIIDSIEYVNSNKLNGEHKKTLYLVDPRANRREIISQNISSDGSTLIISPDGHNKLSSWLSGSKIKNSVFVREGRDIKSSYISSTQLNNVVIGSRSAVFAPIQDLKSIIVLDDAYEQLRDERTPKNHALDCAKILSHMLQIPISVISSIPSVSTFEFETIDRREKDTWPKIEIDDRNSNDPALGNISRKIVSLITKAHSEGLDAAVILSNKANARFLVCKTCNAVASCTKCGHSMIEHQNEENLLTCSVCKESRPVVCSECGGTSFKKYRKGTGATTKDYRSLFQSAQVLEVISENISDVENDLDVNLPKVFIATEAIFHNSKITSKLGVVIFSDIDSSIFRASISAFEQTMVLANRALRAIKRSEIDKPILISTKNMEHPVVKQIKDLDFFTQRELELQVRKDAGFFPYSATVEIKSATEAIKDLKQQLDASVVVGLNETGDSSTLFLRASNHDELSMSSYAILRKFASKNRCALSVDQYD